MATASYGICGASGFGPSSVYRNLPFNGYQDRDPWFLEFIDALGNVFEVLNNDFISATAKANVLDPATDPSHEAFSYLATATSAPTGSANTDTILDLLCYASGVPTPPNRNLSLSQKRDLIGIGWETMSRKGTRPSILKVAASVVDDLVYSISSPPYEFSLIVSDNAGHTGWGDWVVKPRLLAATVATSTTSAQVTADADAFSTDWTNQGFGLLIGTNFYTIQTASTTMLLTLTASATSTVTGQQAFLIQPYANRPWPLGAVREITDHIFPAWAALGIGPSQFRAGFSAAGEPSLTSGATFSLFQNEHFSTWRVIPLVIGRALGLAQSVL